MKLFKHPEIALFLPLALMAAQAPAQKKASPAKPAAQAQKPKPATAAQPKTAAAPAAQAAKPAAADPADPVVLRIGDEAMTKSQFEKFVAALPEQAQQQVNGPNKRRVVEQVAEMKLLAQEARKRKLDSTEKVRQQLALQTDNVLASALFQDLMASAKPDDTSIHAYYDQHKGEYEQVKARHILIRMQGSRVPLKPNQKELTPEEALAKAQEIRKRLLAGEDFATVAKAESDDTGSGANGGDLGAFGRGQMVGPFEQAAFSLPAGQISEPVKTPFGYHLIRVEQKTSKTFEEMKSEIEAQMKPEMARKAVEAIRKQNPIVIDDAFFGKPAEPKPEPTAAVR